MKKINIIITIAIILFAIWIGYLAINRFVFPAGNTYIIQENEMWFHKYENVDSIKIDVSVEKGSTIDVAIMTPEEYGDYTQHLQFQDRWDDDISTDLRQFNTKEYHQQISLKKGNYYIVVDNSRTIGTSPSGEVTVFIRVE